MTPAELRILVTVRSAEAKKSLDGLRLMMGKIAAQTTLASTEMKAFNGVVASSVAPLKSSSAAAADLAAHLALIGKSKAAATLSGIDASASKAQRSVGLLGKNATTAATGLKAINTGSQNAAVGINRLNKSSAGIERLGTVFKGTATGVRSLNTALNQNTVSSARAVGGLNSASAAAERAAAAATASATGFSSSAAAMGAMGAAGAVAGRAATAATTGAAAGAAAQGTFAQRLAGTSEALRKQGSRAQWAGRQISMMFTAPVALAIGMGAKWQLDLEKQQTQLAKVYGRIGEDQDALGVETQKLNKYFRLLSDELGNSQEEITSIGAAWAQAGKSGAALAEYTRLTTEAMILGDITADQAQQSMTALSLQWNLGAKASKITATEFMNMKDAIAAINVASNETQVSYADLLQVMGQAGSIARTSGASFKETLAMATSITRVTGNAAKTGNALKSILTNALKPPKGGGTEWMKKLGVDLESVEGRALTSSQRIEVLAENLSKLDQQGQVEAIGSMFTKWQINAFAQLGKDIRQARIQLLGWSKDITGSERAAQGLYDSMTRALGSPMQSRAAQNAFKGLEIDIKAADYQSMNANARFIRLADSMRGMDEQARKVKLEQIFGPANVGALDKLVQKTNENTEALGNYNREIASTGDKAKNLEQYKKELDKFLESNPQKFKIAGTMMKNALMDVAVILLPYILALAKSIAKMAQAFANMNPTLQKVVIGFLVFLALVGPLAILIASFKVLFGVLGGGMAKLIGFFTVTSTSATGATTSLFRFSAAGRAAARANKAAAAEIAGSSKVGFGAAAKSAMTSARTTVREFATGAKAAAASWKAGIRGIPVSTRINGAQTAAVQTQNNAIMLARINGGMAAIRAAQARGEQARISTIRLYGNLAAIEQSMGMKKQAAAVTAGGAGVVAAQKGVGAAQVAAAGKSGTAAGAAAGAGAARGMKGKLPGILGILATVLFFIPPSWFKAGGDAAKSLGKGLMDGIKNLGGSIKSLMGRMGITSARSFGSAIARTLGGKGGLIGAAIASVVSGIAFAWDDIKKITQKVFGGDSNVPLLARPFVWAVEVIVAAVKKLPDVIVAVFQGIVSFITKAAKKIYEAFSYINPFARHSPSLVENVTNGMAIVTSIFGDASRSIQQDMRNAYGAIYKFGSATAGLNMKAANIKRDDDLGAIKKADPSGAATKGYLELERNAKKLEANSVRLNAALQKQQRIVDALSNKVKIADRNIDQMQKTMESLQKIADATGKALDYAKEQLEYYANAPIKGMRAMSDAIFENEMAQKRLQLEMMKLEDAGGSIDEITDKYARLQGQIETLSGQRADLQQKGAGSDILATYDKMIADLKAQQGAAISSGPAKEIEELNKSLDDLKRKGEMLDLENSLKFDPLTRQIDQLVNTEKELDFSTIVTGVTTYKAQVEGLTIANNLATGAVQAQQAAIDAASASRDALNQRLTLEQEKLDGIKSVYDQNQQAITDVRAAMDELVSSAGTVNQKMEEVAQKAKDAADKAGELGDKLGELGDADIEAPDLSEVGNSLDDMISDMEKKFEGAGLFDGLGEKIKNFFGGLPGKIGGFLGKAMGVIWDFIKKLPGELVRGISYLAGFLVGAAAKLVVAIIVGLYKLSGKIVELVDKAFGWIWEVGIPKLWQKLKDIDWGGMLAGIFTGETWAKLAIALWDAGVWLIKGLFNGIKSMLTNVWDWVFENIIRPIIDGVRDGFGIASPSTVFAEIGNWLVEGLLKGLVDNIVKVFTWFMELPARVITAIGDLAGFLGRKFGEAIQWVRDRLPEWWEKINNFFGGIPGKVGELLGGIGRAIGDKFKGAWDWVSSKMEDWARPVVDWFKRLPDLIGGIFDTVKEKLKTPINFVIGTVYNNGLRKVWNNTAGKVGLPEMGEVQQLAKGGSVGNRIVGPGTGTSDSILTTAKPGSEIFTAREVANAGGFKALESLLGRMGVRSFMSSGTGGVPVALSNGEFRLDPTQIAQIGGSAKVKQLRAQLAAGNVPGHDVGGDIMDVVTGSISNVKQGAKNVAAFGVDKALDAVDALIPDMLTPPGGDIGRYPQKVFDTFREKIINALKGADDVKRSGKKLNAPSVRKSGFATGGTIPSTTGGTGATPSTADTSTGASAAAPGIDPATGAGLVESVTGATAAAQAVWQSYYAAIEEEQLTNATTMQAQQLTADTAMLAQQTATIATMQTASASFRASEIAADAAYQTTLAAQDLASKTLLNSQLATFVSAQTTQWAALRKSVVDTATGMNADVSNQFELLSENIRRTIEDGINPTIGSLEELLNRTVGWFEAASNDIGAMWSQTVPKVQDPTRVIINDVYNNGVRVAWSKVHTWLDLPELDQFVAPFAKGGQLGPEGMVSVNSLSNPNSPKSVKNGGPLRAASSSRDSTLFAGMRGEYVMNRKMVQGAGGISNLEAWRKATLSGRKPIETGGTVNFDAVPGFASGGVLGMDKRPENQALPGVIQEVPERLRPYYNRTYDYGGGGQPGRGYDCSGWTGAVHQILTGGSHVGRIWSTEVNFSSYGYKRGNDGYWSMGVHNGGGGMSSHTAGTLAGVNYESGGAHNTSTWGGPAAGTINPQFENQYYLPSLGGKFIGTPGGGGAVAITPMLLEMWDKEMTRVKEGISGLAFGGTIGQNPPKAYDKFNLLRGVIEKKGKEKDAAAAASAAANYGQGPEGSYGGGVERWRSVVHDALARVGQPKSLDEITLRRMNQESRGNPRAINLWDSNAAQGTPSKGLMQVIDPTFQANRDPSLPNDIWDPMANIVASMRYTLGRYGSLPAGYGRAGGYDSGGWLEPGLTAAVNATGKPEAILTNTDWKAVYKAAMKPTLSIDDIANGYAKGMAKVFGLNTDKEVQKSIQGATEVALQGQNSKWNPMVVDATEDVKAEATKTTEAVYKVTDTVKGTGNIMTGILGATEDNKKVLDQMLAVMNAGAGTLGQIGAKWVKGEDGKEGKWEYNVTFGAFAPLIESIAGLVENLPDAEPTYVSWAGTNREVTKEMQREKQMNDLANSSKGLYYAFKTIAPPVLRSTAKIGAAIETLVQQDGEAWAMISAQLAAGNPTAYLAAAVLSLKAILTILPLVIEAIMSIGPAIIESLIAYFTKFEPDSVYAYGTYEAANDAVVKNQNAIRNGATGPVFETPSVQQEQQSYNFNFYGDVVVPNVTNESGVDTLVGNLLGLAGV
ncbi:putative tape measure protein [Gordonia phage GMA3]|uniref:Putative tape measure protein n=1 Tax=Gordonia phage GMA3 TaxID=1647284 RepID=A0A0K0NKU9_9CAUD|nr:tail length tape measure protein [Gordonia phage GMA3]AKL88193.1 putative tape measure protein [Gordonia phage GMA3]